MKGLLLKRIRRQWARGLEEDRFSWPRGDREEIETRGNILNPFGSAKLYPLRQSEKYRSG
jgi:hypothetical protein